MADSTSRTPYICPCCRSTGRIIKKNIAGQDVVSTCPYCLVMRDSREAARKKEQSRG